MVTAIILSKDRPAQLDLLLRSLERNGSDYFDPIICREAAGKGFEWAVRGWLRMAEAFVCFMCDDGILYRPVDPGWISLNLRGKASPLCLTFSLRLGNNTTICYPSDLPQALNSYRINMGDRADNKGDIIPAAFQWDWTREPRPPGVSDFGYPGSIDGHVFRTEDVRRMLDGKQFPNPTALECALVAGCDELAAKRPLMACYPHSVYVGNPINRVSEQSNVRYGSRFPVTTAECAERFARGERIDLDALDFSQVDGAHAEIELVWR